MPRAVSALAAGLVVRASPSCSLQVPPDHAAMHGCLAHALCHRVFMRHAALRADTQQCWSAGHSVVGMQLNAILLFLRAGCAPEGLLHLPYPMQVTMSSLEIYCEKIRDLLDCSNSNLQVSRALGSLPMLQVCEEH